MFGLLLVAAKCAQQKIHIAVLEVVGGLLDLVLVVHVTVSHAIGPGQVIDAFHALQIHCQTFQPVGDLAGDRPAVDAADLLKIGELGDFHAVQPDFPAQPPRAQRRVLPVVLDEADVVLFEIKAQRFQRTQIQLKDVGRSRFQHNLKLVVMLQTIRIFTVAAILGTAGRLHISSAPGLRPQCAQEGGGVRGARADFHVVGLQQRAALLVPVIL